VALGEEAALGEVTANLARAKGCGGLKKETRSETYG
jgi:hypothetical protein